MKKHIAFLTLAAALLLGSCVKKNDSDRVRLTITASSESTKTALGESIDGFRSIRWEKGDAIKVFYGNNDSDFAVVQASDEGIITTFSVEVPATAQKLYAVYPATAQASFSNGVITVTVPAFQDGKFSAANLAVACSSASNASFSFKHVCSYMLTEIADENIHKMTLTASGQNLSGTIPVTLSESGELSFGTVTDASSTVSARFESAGQPILAILPGVSFTDGASLEFFNADGDPVSSQSIKKDFTLNRGSLLNIGKPE